MEYMEAPGVFSREASVKAYDGLANITISKGTNFRTIEKWAGSYITFEPQKEDSPEASPDSSLISLVYKLGPEGATFDPPTRLNIIYNKDNIPKGINETDIEAAFFDGSVWQTIESRVDTEKQTVTSLIDRMGQYALVTKKTTSHSPLKDGPAVYRFNSPPGPSLSVNQATAQKNISAPELIQEMQYPGRLNSSQPIDIPSTPVQSPSPVQLYPQENTSWKWIAVSMLGALGIAAVIIVYCRKERRF
jgi:hypothetical protein